MLGIVVVAVAGHPLRVFVLNSKSTSLCTDKNTIIYRTFDLHPPIGIVVSIGTDDMYFT